MEIPTKCWYCGKGPMVNDSRITKCQNCGATWTPPMKLGPVVMQAHRHGTELGVKGSPGPGAIVRDLNTGEILPVADE